MEKWEIRGLSKPDSFSLLQGFQRLGQLHMLMQPLTEIRKQPLTLGIGYQVSLSIHHSSV